MGGAETETTGGQLGQGQRPEAIERDRAVEQVGVIEDEQQAGDRERERHRQQRDLGAGRGRPTHC